MTLHLQRAKANLPASGKDEDTVFFHSLASDSGLLLGVADGISDGNGRDAAQWIANVMSELAREPSSATWDARELFARFAERLSAAAEAGILSDSHSTLTCGIARCNFLAPTPFVRLDFFGIGDSPIWRVVRSSVKSLRYQASVVYGPPVPSEMTGLYSWVNLSQGRVHGSIHFGSVDFQEGELLIVSTDGVPESRVLIQDQDDEDDRASPRLVEKLLNASQIDDALLLRLLQDYDEQRLLIDDDASLVVLRLARPIVPSSSETEPGSELLAVAALPCGEDDRASGGVISVHSLPQGEHPLPVARTDLPAEVRPEEETQALAVTDKPHSGKGTKSGWWPKKLSHAQRKRLNEQEEERMRAEQQKGRVRDEQAEVAAKPKSTAKQSKPKPVS